MGRQWRFFVFALALIDFGASPCFAQEAAGSRQQLLEAAKNGRVAEVEALLKAGVATAVRDTSGRTALHLAAQGGHQATAQALLDHGADVNIKDNGGRTPLDAALANGHTGTAQFLQSKGAVKGAPAASTVPVGSPTSTAQTPRSFHPDAAFPTLESFSKGFPGVRGGTSGCVIKYTDENLDLASQSEWKQYHVPHVSGYIEEMAHSFAHATGAEFGWEMIGWSISAKVSEIVAPNPIHQRQVAQTRHGQAQTHRRYMATGQTFPTDLPGDQADRIHAYLLRKCELQYGPDFWTDFFKEVRQERPALFAPEAQGESAGLNVRYRITVECLDRLPGLNFKKLLEENGISATIAIQSLKPTSPGWNRKLQ